MRRFFIGCAAAGLLLAGGALASSTVAEATTAPSAPAAVHPVVGSWQLSVDEFPDDPPSLVAFHADGTYQESDSDGTDRHRVVGSDRAELGEPHVHGVRPQRRRLRRDADDSRHGEVSADGQTFTGQFTVEFTGEGFPTGEYGPGHVTATRINVEPMGTPVGSLDDLFSQFGGPSTPAGTEAVATRRQAPNRAGTAPAGTTAGDRADGHGADGHHADGHRTGRHHARGGDHGGLTTGSTLLADLLPNR